MKLFLMSVMCFALIAPTWAADKVEKKSAKKVEWKELLPPKAEVANYMQEISVTIKALGSEGSGVVKTRNMKIDNKEVKINFVWTAAHVVDGLRRVEEVIDPRTGTKRQVVQFKDAEVVKELVENGRRVGELKMDAEVIKFNREQDLAVLKIRKRDFIRASVIFYLEGKTVPLGTDVYHVGSLLGQMGSNSMTSGIISQIGRVIDKREFDQSTATAFPGSSGGGLFLKTDNVGAYIGMITRGAGEGFNLFVPIRRIQAWAVKNKIEWALDDNVPMPTEEQLQKLPVEDIGVDFVGDKPIEKPAPIPAGTLKSIDEFPILIKHTHLGPL